MQRGQRLGVGHLGHGHLVDEGPSSWTWNDVGQVEDGLAVLDGHHPAGGEGAAVADPVDLVEDGHVGVPGAQEVGVQRVHAAPLDGAPRRHERLGRHLAPEHPLAVLVGAHAAEDVDLDGLDVEQLDEEVQRVAHHHILAGPTATVSPCRPSTSPKGSCGGPPPPPTRSRGATPTTTGGPSSTPRGHRVVESSGDACDSWHRWPEDLDLVAALGLGAYRFSVEWSRIEPEEGEWSGPRSSTTAASAPGCHELGLSPVVTLNHFTIPRWLARRAAGGSAAAAPERFARFCERVAAHLGDLVGLGVHAQRAQRGGHDGVPPRGLPPGGARLGPAPGGQRRLVPRPRAGGRGAAGAARATSRSGSPCR